ncbi:MAG: porin family protein [Treponema sp.]|nr:porin family protein [Treponema sp.]
MRTIVFLALLAGVSTGAFAQFTISGGFALSTMTAELEGLDYSVEGGVGVGGNVYLDYLLPISIPLSLGFEIGVDSATIGIGDWEDKVLAIPLLLRTAYHFDLMPKLDLYAVAKIGYVIGALVDGPDKEYFKSSGGVGFGIDVGAAYYFTSIFGLFGEAGFDGYMLETKLEGYGTEFSFNTPFYRFVTIGVSVRRQ